MSQGGRTVILSDMHLGRPGAAARDAEALRPLWYGAERLIINGDAAELADTGYRVQAARQVLAIEQMCEEDGVELTLLPGNHDPMISERRHIELHGGEIFITHGDALHPAISPWTAHHRQLRQFHDYTLDALDEDARSALAARLDAAGYASHLTWDAWYWHEHHGNDSPLRRRLAQAVKIARVLWYWQTLPRQAARFARRYAPDARFFIFGHIHRAGIWRRGRQTLINTGSYDFPARPRGVVIEAGQLAVHRIRPTGDTFALAPRPVASFPLRSAA